MSTKYYLKGNQIPTRSVAVVMMACSGLWLVCAEIYWARSGFSQNWSATPLPWMLGVVAMPSVCFSGALILLDAGKRARLGLVERWGLAAIALPVTAGTLLSAWAVKGLFTMSGY